MCAAVLMSDSWQPTVLQLMPFSNNNACCPNHRDSERLYSREPRGFPTLAVTRSQADESRGFIPRAASERKSRSHSFVVGKNFRYRAQSEYLSRSKQEEGSADALSDSNNLHCEIANSPNRDSRSPDTLSSASFTEIPKSVKLLPKPSFNKSLDGRYFLPQNGFWRSMTLTPGELDLQKHRDSLTKEQTKKKNKRHKLNVNQLPRSTTPINDYDPDKLNMKQVIKFLQTKGMDEVSNAKPKPADKNYKEEESGKSKKGYLSSAVHIVQRSSGNGQAINSSFDQTSLRPGVTNGTNLSNMSTRNSPILRRRSHKSVPKEPEDVKVVWDEDSSPSSNKSIRQFRLHRFLTMAPNASEFTHVLKRSPTQVPSSPAHKPTVFSEGLKLPEPDTDRMRNCPSSSASLPYSPSRIMGERFNRLSYRLPAKRTIVTENSKKARVNGANANTTSNKVVPEHKGEFIRLPTMRDFQIDSDDESNGGEHNWAHTNLKLPSDISKSEDSLTLKSSTEADVDSIPVHYDTSSESLKSNSKPPSRKVHVSLPSQTEDAAVSDKRSQDVVRLSLRQERDLTREKSYMGDLAESRSRDKQRESSSFKYSAMSMQHSRDDDIELNSRTS